MSGQKHKLSIFVNFLQNYKTKWESIQLTIYMYMYLIRYCFVRVICKTYQLEVFLSLGYAQSDQLTVYMSVMMLSSW